MKLKKLIDICVNKDVRGLQKFLGETESFYPSDFKDELKRIAKIINRGGVVNLQELESAYTYLEIATAKAYPDSSVRQFVTLVNYLIRQLKELKCRQLRSTDTSVPGSSGNKSQMGNIARSLSTDEIIHSITRKQNGSI